MTQEGTLFAADVSSYLAALRVKIHIVAILCTTPNSKRRNQIHWPWTLWVHGKERVQLAVPCPLLPRARPVLELE
jgi:hypothetical protein